MRARPGRSADRRGSCARACPRAPRRSSAAPRRTDRAPRGAPDRPAGRSAADGKDREVLVEKPADAGSRREEAAARLAASARGKRCVAADGCRITDETRCNARSRPPEALVPRRDPVAVVAEEQLVRAFARQHHLHVLAGQPRDEVESERSTGTRSARPRARRAAAARGRTRSGVTTTSRCCAPTARAARRAYGSSLASARRSPPRTCGSALHHAGHERGEPARVDAAGQEQPERHVAHQMALARLARAGRAVPSHSARSEPAGGRPRRPEARQ